MPKTLGITKSMSEAKNTALGSRAAIGYSHVSPAKHHPPLATTTAMISLTFILTALVVLTSVDAADAEDSRSLVPVRNDDDSTSLNR
jgi:hypothetical protein